VYQCDTGWRADRWNPRRQVLWRNAVRPLRHGF